MISDLEVVLRLVLAVFLSGLVGLEREVKGRAAGFRTHILVCTGSALVMLTGVYLSAVWNGKGGVDPTPTNRKNDSLRANTGSTHALRREYALRASGCASTRRIASFTSSPAYRRMARPRLLVVQFARSGQSAHAALRYRRTTCSPLLNLST